MPAGPGGQLGQPGIRRRTQHVGGHPGDRVVAERAERDPVRAVPLQQVEQQRGATARRRGAPGQLPDQRIGGQLAGQHTERGQRGPVGPVQVVQADQYRMIPGALFQQNAELVHQPDARLRRVGVAGLGRQRAGRSVQRRQQRGKRHRPAQLVRGRRDEGEPPPGRLVGGRAEQPRFADAWFAFDEQDPAVTAGTVADESEGDFLLAITPPHGRAPGGPIEVAPR